MMMKVNMQLVDTLEHGDIYCTGTFLGKGINVKS